MHQILNPLGAKFKSQCSEAKEFLDRIRPDTRIGLIYHGDADGCAAAAMIAAMIEHKYQNGKCVHYWVGTHQFSFIDMFRFLYKHNFETLIFLDINLDSKSGTLQKLASSSAANILVYDDHIVGSIPDAQNLVFLNPNVAHAQPHDLPACYFVYSVVQEFLPHLTPWVVAVGLIGDSVLDRFRTQLPDNTPKRDELFPIVKVVSSYYLNLESNNEDDPCFKVLKQCILEQQDFWSVLENSNDSERLKDAERAVTLDVEKNLSRYYKLQENFKSHHGEITLIVMNVIGNTRIPNIVASRLRSEVEQTVIVTYQAIQRNYMIELRTSPDLHNLDLARVLKRIFLDLPSINHGGHPVAAGATIAKRYLTQFIQRLEHELEAWTGA